MVTVAAAVLDDGAVWDEAFVTALAVIVRMIVPGEQPESATVYVVPDPEGVPTVQPDAPVPLTEKSAAANPVTVSLNITL